MFLSVFEIYTYYYISIGLIGLMERLPTNVDVIRRTSRLRDNLVTSYDVQKFVSLSDPTIGYLPQSRRGLWRAYMRQYVLTLLHKITCFLDYRVSCGGSVRTCPRFRVSAHYQVLFRGGQSEMFVFLSSSALQRICSIIRRRRVVRLFSGKNCFWKSLFWTVCFARWWAITISSI